MARPKRVVTEETPGLEQITEVTATPVKKTRKSRTPVGGKRDILTIQTQDPNYRYRWVLDVPGRLERFREGGYEEVIDDVEVGQNTVDRGSRIGKVITKAGGGGRTLVAMRIPREWYDEDQATKMEQLDLLDQRMMIGDGKADYGAVTLNQMKGPK